MIISTRYYNQTQGKIRLRCSNCGKVFETLYETAVFLDPMFKNHFINIFETQLCDECVAVNIKEQEEKERIAKQKAFASMQEERCDAASIPVDFRKSESPNKELSDMLNNNKDKHVVITGVTGSGKTSSVSSVLSNMLAEGKNVKYYPSLSALARQYVDAKRSDSYGSADRFFSKLNQYDIIAIDECFGKGKLTETTEELMYALLDTAYTGSSQYKLWLIGNLYGGALDKMFIDNADVVRRKLNNSFLCLATTKKGARVAEISTSRTIHNTEVNNANGQ